MITADQALKMLEDKGETLKAILDIMNDNQKNQLALTSLLENFDTLMGFDAGRRKAIKAMAQAIKQNTRGLGMCYTLLLIYSQGNQIDSDVGNYTTKLGRGEDALKAMFKGKFG